MLPLRTFMNAVLQIHPKNMIWDGKKQTATVLYGAYILIFDLKNNTILKNGEALPVWGKMEVKDGRVFVPLRNWSGILQSIGYLIEEGDITWDSTTKLATVRAVEQKLDPSNGLEKPALSGKGAQASYAVALSTQYDEIEPLGDGYFLAQKCTGETNIGLGHSSGSGIKNVRYLLDGKGKVLHTYDTGTDVTMWGGGDRDMILREFGKALYTGREGAEPPILLCLHAYLFFMNVFAIIREEPLEIDGETVNLRILFRKDEKPEADDHTGWTGIGMDIAENGAFGNYAEVRATPFWDILIFLYRKKFEKLHSKR